MSISNVRDSDPSTLVIFHCTCDRTLMSPEAPGCWTSVCPGVPTFRSVGLYQIRDDNDRTLKLCKIVPPGVKVNCDLGCSLHRPIQTSA